MKTLIFDTETTGLIRNSLIPLERQPKIIEFFGMTIDENFMEISNFTRLYNPGFSLDPEIVRITGITDEMLVDVPALNAERFTELKQFIEGHDEVVAHNLRFDRDMISLEMRRAEASLVWPKQICTVEATIHYKGFRLNLRALHSLLFEEEFAGAHRAEADVRALARCFIELRKRGEV